MPNYQNGMIYTVRYKKNPNLIYVGSTTDYLCNRWAKHRYEVLNGRMNHLLYKTMKETDDIDNWYIELYEKYPCNDKQELHKREGEIIRDIGTLNLKVAGRNTKNYYTENKDKVLEMQKKYAEKNKEKIASNKKNYYEDNKEKLEQYQKQYYKDNKDNVLDYHKEYYKKNKVKFLEKQSEMIQCDCGSKLQNNNLLRHLKTQKHLKWEATQVAASN